MHVLLINPWIEDFSAFDLWAKPIGLLTIGGILFKKGVNVHMVDCLGEPSKRRSDGRGKFHEEVIAKPKPLAKIPRFFRKYGITTDELMSRLKAVPQPDAVLVTSGMTYWYLGVLDTIRTIRKVFPKTLIVLGGIYATLCSEHARKTSGADVIVEGDDLGKLFKVLGLGGTPPGFQDFPHPFITPEKSESAVLLTSRGCPFRCSYCASPLLNPKYEKRTTESVNQEIEERHRQGTRHFAFYDDALLFSPEDHIVHILNKVIENGCECRFHTPNGLNIRGMTHKLAVLMKKAGFETIRLGFESSSRSTQMKTGAKISNDEFLEAVKIFHEAGYSSNKIGVYILAGLPFQDVGEVEESINFVKQSGARPIIAEYSPIPGTGLWEEACKSSPFPLKDEPLFHNNTILPCRWKGFKYDDLQRVKDLSRSNSSSY